jgi:hypothetical protein
MIHKSEEANLNVLLLKVKMGLKWQNIDYHCPLICQLPCGPGDFMTPHWRAEPACKELRVS